MSQRSRRLRVARMRSAAGEDEAAAEAFPHTVTAAIIEIRNKLFRIDQRSLSSSQPAMFLSAGQGEIDGIERNS